MQFRRMLVTVFAVSLALTACGRDDDDDGAAPATPTETSEAPAPPVPGVTDEACTDAVNPDNGCIYLGIVSDLTDGPFAALAVPVTAGQAAFWQRVNEEGGIGGYDIDVTTYVRDNHYMPEVHNQVYQEIKDSVLALAQTLGTPTTQAILEDLNAESIVAAPASWTSLWAFEDVIIESGASYCFESMNSVDYAIETYGVGSVMAVGYPGDYGGDAAAGAEIAAEANGLEFSAVETAPGENQDAAIGAILQGQPDLVIVTTGPLEAATIVGGAAANAFTGRFIGTSPTWNPALLASPAADALIGLYEQSGPWGTWATETAGHAAMREALGDVETINDGYTSGWVWSYPMKAALEAAVAADNLTREGLAEAVRSLTSVDYEGMLPEGAGNYAGDPNSAAVRATLISGVDPESPTGVSVVQDFTVGPTAEAYELTGACFL